jgi:hypothetical protein
MTTNLDASNLSLEDVHQLFQLERFLNNSITSILTLEPLAESEQQELQQIRDNFDSYYTWGKISEGEIKFMTISPLLWLAGFYPYSRIRITLEEKIAEIYIKDEDKTIKGRMDIVAVHKIQESQGITPFCVLVIETKNSEISALTGLPQLLTYLYKCLDNQQSAWGLTTNGMDYQFVHIQPGNPNIYQQFPSLNLIYPQSSIQILQILKAICKLSLSF